MKISTPSIAIAAAASSLLGTPASAQGGASWAVGDSAVTTITYAGAPLAPPQLDRSPEEMALLFRAACIETGGTEAGIDAAVASGRLQLVGSTFKVPATKKKPAYSIRFWTAPGVVVARTDGFPEVEEAQCNATFNPPAGPRNAELADAVTAVLAAPPANASEAVKKNGKRNKGFTPRWIVAGQPGESKVVTAVAMRANRFTPGDHVLIAIRPEPARR